MLCVSLSGRQYADKGDLRWKRSYSKEISRRKLCMQCLAFLDVAAIGLLIGNCMDDAPPGCAEYTWPVLRECMGNTNNQFFLSYTELLLLAEVKERNVIIFGLQNGQAKYLGATLGHAEQNIRLVGLHVGCESRVRTALSAWFGFPTSIETVAWH